MAINGLSKDHSDYLAAGGYGFIIGDGALRYGTERVLESYYSATIVRAVTISFDYERLVNPAYNRDRGPVNVFAVRTHVEF